MPFNPKPEYTISPKLFPVGDFYRYADEFVTRPPYQRKGVWSTKKKQALLDSLFRRYYIPKIVIREVRLNNDKAVNEVVDGQQRIIVVQEFFDNKLKLPKSLSDIHAGLADKYYNDLGAEFKRFVDKELQYDADVVRGIDDPHNPQHQKIATEIFWRLQQGESLNFMEIAHARLASLVRNFVVKYADDITFDFSEYKPIDNNPNKHKFFNIYSRDNDRMQHLLLLTRFLLLEKANGPTELRDSAVADFIDETISPNGIGNETYENDSYAKAVISNLNTFYEIFKGDPMLDEKSGLKELSRDYTTISFYLLLRHLKNNYILNENSKKLFHDFIINEFYPRWTNISDEDNDVLLFSSSRQMDQNNIEERSQILRQLFFEFVNKQNAEILTKDNKRNFNEAQKIMIYRHNKGFCQLCLSEGKSEKEAQVSWGEYEADHILAHSQGGTTDINNAQVLCRYHNRKKSGK
ncbi:MAG: hypothetical protein UV05_C0025G0001 [candidate division CPR1 bacterium GW2011_GWA2_42_17]|uniref:HNH nuclease domain-containing protein n=1 Tax=candidate division CPR1 bacterium GW2011_GWA2_42_17 TaxID=1618341 RepID=A0A0G0Z4N0_9BACT|nr:MAG: hypothetical protein UV05_C0025G0001 [candidate division CPR1 bacterium GW2011_GWA2_42_17]